MSALVIVESPTKAKKIRQYLGADFAVEASVGHVRDLPKSKLGVDIDNNFAPTYETMRGSGKIVTKLKKMAKDADALYLATDPDREGEAIAWHLLEAWDDPKLTAKSKRAVFHEITPDAVKDAIEHPKKLNDSLVDAQQARRVLDRLVGYQLSPLLWKKVRRGLSAGRVQSVALRLIVERELEIEAFKPEEYWEVDVHVKTAQHETIVARVYELQGKKYDPKQETDVAPLREWAKLASYSVQKIEKKERTRQPNAPFTTSTLQQQASTRLGFSVKRTMQLAQQLYEEGLITYHRTDSTNLSQQAVAAAREYIAHEFGSEFVPKSVPVYGKKSKNAQEAHEAIRTTALTPKMALSGKLDEGHAKLYDLIFRRYVASQMTPAKFDVTTVHVDGEHQSQRLTARSTGSVIRHAGWMALFPGSEDTILPDVQEGQSLDFSKLDTQQKFTQPPARYNDASLVKELEKRGIGRPSTFASIISVIINRGYVERVAKAFKPTAVGRTVTEFLLKNFEQVMDFDFTAKMEDQLDDIALGKAEWTKVMKDFYGSFVTKLKEVDENAVRMTVPVEPLDKPCPECGLKPEAFAKELAAGKTMSGHPHDESNSFWREKPHGELVIRTGRFGKFISCSRYPECKHAEKFQETIDMACPQCNDGQVVVKRTKKGRLFYGCSRYPDCDFASWKKPEKE